jgi:hypothetical protein
MPSDPFRVDIHCGVSFVALFLVLIRATALEFRRGESLVMPKESCLDHRKREKLVLIRETFVRLCANDHCAASLLTLLEYLTNGELERLEKSEEQGEPWIRASMNSICSDMMDHYSRRSIQERMRWFRVWGVVGVDDSVCGEIRRYLLNVDVVNLLLQKRVVLDVPPPAKLPHPTTAKPDCVVADGSSAKSTQIDDLYIKEEVYVNRGSINQSSDPTPPRTPRSPTLDLADLYLEDSIEKFTQDVYSRVNRSAKLENLRAKSSTELCERMRDVESDYGPVEFRGRLIGFLQADTDWLRQTKWPINAFLKDPSKYERVSAPPPSSLVDFRQPLPNGTSTHTPVNPTTLPEEADIWNEVVKSGIPVGAFDWLMVEGRNLAVCREHPQFTMANWRKICEKVQPILDAGEGAWLTFHWLIKAKDNWWKAFTGQYDNCAKPKTNGKPPKVDLLAQDRKEAEEYERKRKLERTAGAK